MKLQREVSAGAGWITMERELRRAGDLKVWMFEDHLELIKDSASCSRYNIALPPRLQDEYFESSEIYVARCV